MVFTINDTNINTKYTEQKKVDDDIIICSSDEIGTVKAADTMFSIPQTTAKITVKRKL